MYGSVGPATFLTKVVTNFSEISRVLFFDDTYDLEPLCPLLFDLWRLGAGLSAGLLLMKECGDILESESFFLKEWALRKDNLVRERFVFAFSCLRRALSSLSNEYYVSYIFMNLILTKDQKS